jgi:NitT/TauT family transport system substrate-binding protein
VVAGAAAVLPAVLAASACSSSSGATTSSSGSLKPINLAASSVAITVGFANYAIEQPLGCYAKAGYQLNLKTYPGTSNGLLVALQHGQADLATLGSDQFEQLQETINKSGSSFPLTAVYENAYPYHWGLAVQTGSSITTVKGLVGKTVGVDTLGNSSVPLLKAALKANGVDPNSVKVTATGSGAPVGTALQTGKVDAIFTSDTTMGTILQDGVNLRFITDGSKPLYQDLAGVVIVSPAKSLNSPMVQAFDKCTTEGNIFVQANPVAAAYLMFKQYPQLGSPGASLSQTLAKLAFSLEVRERTLHSVDASVPYGQMNAQEFTDNLTLELGQPASALSANSEFTNKYVPQLTDAEVQAIQKQAKDYKIPGLATPVTLPSLPANTP